MEPERSGTANAQPFNGPGRKSFHFNSGWGERSEAQLTSLLWGIRDDRSRDFYK